MNEIIVSTSIHAIALPAPKVAIGIRPGVMSDVPFLDSLQKMHTKQVGWMPTAQFEGKIKLGHVIIAEDEQKTPLGYCIGSDQYFKRDDVGIIYQMNIVPDRQRGLIGARLVKAMFDRAAWGCKLFCCWCAQDIEANYFWESLGFVPLAFRAGSRGKGRVHIFWQRRIRGGDCDTPYWFPSQTSSGSIREDRIVLPIPPGTHWRDAKPLVLPSAENNEPKQLPTPKQKKPKKVLMIKPAHTPSGGLWFAVPRPAESQAKPKREPKPKVKNDPKLVAAARELRDRWLEQVNAAPLVGHGKYEVSRAIEDQALRSADVIGVPALPASIAA